MKISKYYIGTYDYQTIQMPRGARILSVKAHSNGQIYVWVAMSESEALVQRRLRVIGSDLSVYDLLASDAPALQTKTFCVIGGDIAVDDLLIKTGSWLKPGTSYVGSVQLVAGQSEWEQPSWHVFDLGEV